MKKNFKRFFTLKHKANDGFTLVELIVVIAILAILGGVAVPAYSGYIEKSKRAADDTLLAAVNTAYASACAANGSDIWLETSATASASVVGGKVTAISPAAYDEAFTLFFEGNEDAVFQVYTQLRFDDDKHVFFGMDEAAVIEAIKQYIANSNFNGKLDELTGDVGTLIDVLSGYLGQGAIEDIEGSGFGDYLTDVLGLTDTDDPDKMANAAVLYLAHTAANMTDENIMMAKGTLANALIAYKNEGVALDAGVISAMAESTGSGLAGYAMLYATAEALAIQQGGDVYDNLKNAPLNGPQDVLNAVSGVFESVDASTINTYLGTDENSQYSKDMDAYFETMQAVNSKENELKGELDGGPLTENQIVQDMINELK